MEIIRILMNRDGYTKKEAIEICEEIKERILDNGEDPDDVLYEYDLEPDYIEDIIEIPF